MCLSVNGTDVNVTAKTVTFVFTFRNASSKCDAYYNVTETVQAVSTDGYNTTNAIHYLGYGHKNLTDTLIFSDGKTCAVFFVPHQENGCELWVEQRYASHIPDCCMFVFDVFCAKGKIIYDKYNVTECLGKASS
ncbi:male-specific histamine-binding salivary protein-like [Dermacentor albipictus]|uniref:male-specific histamine-binding salivary protein-like n=1 Tax=Dermacentor albipictus TaxID=60249 RepID=UPI0038FCC769